MLARAVSDEADALSDTPHQLPRIFIQFDQSDLVVDAIRHLIDREWKFPRRHKEPSPQAR